MSDTYSIPVHNGLAFIFGRLVYFVPESRDELYDGGVFHKADKSESAALLAKLESCDRFDYLRDCPCDANGTFQPEIDLL